jgi:cell surface protein SprA
MAVVTKKTRGLPSIRTSRNLNSNLILAADTPETDEEKPDLKYNFKDNDGKRPLVEPKSKLYLENPDNIKTEVQYDPKTGNYDIKQNVGNLQYRPETFMTQKEYRDYVFKKQMREYWRSRVAADELNSQPRKGMIPKLQINSELFERIFGGNTVDIKPTGTAELIFGLNYNKNLNPAIPQRQQRITNFDFNMRIQLNLIGKIGDKLKVTTNYNTEASFDWENQVKMDYTGYEDDIIKKIEAGNVTLPLNSSLISGSQTLFGFKTALQFGKLTATTVFSQQKGKKQEVTVQGGAQTQQFSLGADNYETNKHFFLSHYFREKYDSWMSTLPIVNTPIIITKIEVYLLGINGSAEQTRNIVAFEDLAEDDAYVFIGTKTGINPSDPLAIKDNFPNDSIPRNEANNLYSILTNTVDGLILERNIDKVSSLLTSRVRGTINSANPDSVYMIGSRDYNIIRNARRLNNSEYTFNPRLGYISLNQQLNNDQSLAVSYQFTYGNKIFQVGEFSDNVPDNKQLVVSKLLKSTVVNVRQPMWQLMMKNVYALGAYNLNPQDFRLDVLYNNIETGVDVPYIPASTSSPKVNGQQLIKVLNCDRLSVNGDLFPDGVYDFINGFTIYQANGRAYFPTVEPFGRSLAKKFDPNDLTAKNFIFNELYDSTKVAATFVQNKNRFKIKGSYRSSSGSEIALNALNIPQGAVIVTANGVQLAENTDYTVDYNLGRVKIINDGILNSGATIKVSLESNSLFSVQQRNLIGTRLDYKAGRNLTIGSTILRFSERPLTQKVALGEEPVRNSVIGLDFNYKSDFPLLTRLLDKLPFYSTKEMSNVSMRGEIAKLFPGNAKAINRNGGNSYIDDFEGSVALIDIKGANSWFLASVPQGQPNFFREASRTGIIPGINRARFNWYNVDAMFTRDQNGTTPSYYQPQKLFSNNMWRQVFETELFPGKIPPNGQQVVLPTLDLLFNPNERGPYNYDVKEISGIAKGINKDGSLANPKGRWGGIMRRLETNDFQSANVEYIQFWMMDPFNEDYKVETDSLFDKNNLPTGDMYINLGNISEDIIKDGRMVYENGIPGNSSFSQNLKIDTNSVANVPVLPPIINAFSQDNNDRPLQDVGYDGLSDEAERERFRKQVADASDASLFDQNAPAIKNFVSDPSSDRYHFFRGDDYDAAQFKTIKRYSRYNNPEGNSPTEAQYNNANPRGGNYPTGATTLPNIEDINRDNTLSEAENYYQYHIKISPNAINPASIGTNFIVDAFNGSADFSGITKTVKWYQFKIPVSQFESNVGQIDGFNSIRFMRVYMKGFDKPVLVRLARFELVRSDWRRYQFDLKQNGEYIATDNNTTSFDVSAVSLQENSNKVPVNYIMPPDIEQQQNVQTTNLVLLNEQALQMRVCDLKDGDSRAIFKNVELDSRMFENIKMNVHAEPLNNQKLNDGDLNLFFRVGTDYNNNYYEYEIPLKLTPKGLYDPNNTDARYAVWPKENEVNFNFEDIKSVKELRNATVGYTNLEKQKNIFSIDKGGYTITIVGNPNLATIRSIMVGIRNVKTNDAASHCAEVWINELRLTNFNNSGGWATTGQIQAKLADLGNLALTGTYKSPFWGSVESKINDRSRETDAIWDVNSSINAGKFFPAGLKITLPVFFSYGQTKITPLFNPLDPDVRMASIRKAPISDGLRDSISNQTIDYTERKGFNVTNVRIDGLKRAKAKPMPLDVSNFSFTYAYNEIFKRSVNVEYNYNRQQRGSLQYAFTIKEPLTIKPFTKIKFLDNKWLGLIRDFNLQLLPNSFSWSMDANRNYAAVKNRDITSFYGKASDSFINPALVNKNFTLSRNYTLIWNISKSIKFDYSANNDGRILEPRGEYWKSDKVNRDSVLNTFLYGRIDTIRQEGQIKTLTRGRFGENTVYRQNMNVNVDIPINRIYIFDFIKSTYRYGGTYTWNRRPFAAVDSIGNTIQNTNSQSLTGNFEMMKLYNKIPFFKRVNNPVPKVPKTKKSPLTEAQAGPKKAMATVTETTAPKENNISDFAALLAKTVMMVKNISITFQKSGGQLMPNFKPNSQYGGMDFENKQAPGFLFTTGLPDGNIRQNSIRNGWIAPNANQTTAYTENIKTDFTYRANVEPHSSFKIEFTGNYSYSKNISEFIVKTNEGSSTDLRNYILNSSPNIIGNFNITTFNNFKTFSDGSDPIKSNLFEDFLRERDNVARDLSAANSGSYALPGPQTNTLTRTAFYDGYSQNQQDVLLGSFYRVYVGKDIENYSTKNIFPKIPIPNWNATWDGLGKIKALKKTFRAITIRHAYRSIYSINSFNNNILFNPDGKTQDQRMPVQTGQGTTPNFIPYYNINSVTLSERFDPLIKFDLMFNKPGWSANIEMRRDKTTNLNLTAFQIIETKGQEYVIGLGYRVNKLKLGKLTIQGKPLESPLTVRIDLSYRKNINIIRLITDGSSQPTGGANIITLRSSADYQLTPNVNFRLFLDWIKQNPQTSAAFPTSNINGGFSLRINFS